MRAQTPEQIAKGNALRLSYSTETVDTSVSAGREKKARVDLGLELLLVARKPGVELSQHDIAAWAGCTRGWIYLIEQKALKKLANALRFGRERGLRKELA